MNQEYPVKRWRVTPRNVHASRFVEAHSFKVSPEGDLIFWVEAGERSLPVHAFARSEWTAVSLEPEAS